MNDIFTGAAAPLTPSGFEAAVLALGEPHDGALLRAVLDVMGAGAGFLPDRRPQLRWERHLFHQRTAGRFAADHPDLSDPVPGGNGSGPDEYQRLKRAMLLDRRAALESGRWGLGWVPGFRARFVGHADVEAMVGSFRESEKRQLEAFVALLRASPALHDAYRGRDWTRLAFFLEGGAGALTKADTQLAGAYARLLAGAEPLLASRLGMSAVTGGSPAPIAMPARVAPAPPGRTVTLLSTQGAPRAVSG